MDQFMEEVVTKKNRGMEGVLYALANVMMVLSAIIGFFMLQNVIMGVTRMFETGFDITILISVLITLVFCGCALLLFLRKDRIRTEYEYTFTNGSLDFAQVYNNKKRKNLGSMTVRNLDAFGKVSSGSFQRYVTMPGIKRLNWFLNREAELYYCYFTKDSKKTILIFEPSEDLVGMIRKNLGQGVYQIN